MKKIATLLGIAALGVLLACEDEPGPGPAAPQLQPTAHDLIGLLPGSTLAAVGFLDLADRWDELRATPRLARLQDRLLAQLGLDADDVPQIAGSYAVIAFVADDAWRGVVPVAVLDPPSPADALARLARSDALVAIESRGAIWAGPLNQVRLIERVAAGDGTSLRQTVDFSALTERLPPGGLVRAVINPHALGEHLLRQAEYARGTLAAKFARLMGADLEAVETAGFRRDIVDGQLVTDVWVGIDSEVVPEAYARALAEHRGPAALPVELPADVLLAKSFRTEPEAGLAWLRALAARDPGGPLRNLDFWIDEFEARTSRSVDRDIVDALGERGLVLLMEADGWASLELVAILDAREPERLEAALIDLGDWLAEQISGRTLGLAIPGGRRASEGGGVAHALEFWTPFRSIEGPVFQLANDRLVVATSRRSLALGVELARAAETWRTPDWALGDVPPDEIVLIRTSALARAVLARAPHSTGQDLWVGAVEEFLVGAGEGRVRVDYQERGFRITGTLRVDRPSGI